MTASLDLGAQIVPAMSAQEIVDTVRLAEDLGFDYCMVADEGLMHDVYVVVGAAAAVTSTIRLGVVTNPYTRHPAVTAAGVATSNELSGGRGFVTLVPGGTMVLDLMGISRTAPAAMMADTIQVLRHLWSGESVTWTGQHHRLRDAQLDSGEQDIPIWVAARGERLLALAGDQADGVVLMAKSDLADALEMVDSFGSPKRVYLDRLAYTPAMVEEAKELYGYALMDSPTRMLENLGIDDGTIQSLRAAMATGGPAGVVPLITDEMVAAFQIAGSPDQCREELAALIGTHDFEVFIINLISPGIEANERLLRDVLRLTRDTAGS
jgi:5,10-methylenetetrahydromethanopterin reductase